MKRRKNLETERKYRQLQAEAGRRTEKAAVERNYESDDEKEDELLPRYEDVTGDGQGGSSTAATAASNAPHSSSGTRGADGDAPPPGYGNSEPSRLS